MQRDQGRAVIRMKGSSGPWPSWSPAHRCIISMIHDIIGRNPGLAVILGSKFPPHLLDACVHQSAPGGWNIILWAQSYMHMCATSLPMLQTRSGLWHDWACLGPFKSRVASRSSCEAHCLPEPVPVNSCMKLAPLQTPTLPYSFQTPIPSPAPSGSSIGGVSWDFLPQQDHPFH